MIRLIAVAFALALASSVQAMPPVPAQLQSDQLVTQVRQGCGAGMVRRAGVCVPRGSVAAAAGYGSSTNLTPGYASNPNYGYGTGPRHDPGGPMRNGDMCWSDKDAWANTGQGYWKACPK